MEVPLIVLVEYGPVFHVLRMLRPGAKTSTQVPQLEK